MASRQLDEGAPRLPVLVTDAGVPSELDLPLGEDELGGYAASTTAGFVFEARQNLWKKDAAWAELAAALVGESLATTSDDLTAAFGANGAVTAKLKVGKNVFSGASVFCPTEFADGKVCGRVYLYFAPNTAKKFKGAVRVVDTGFLPEGVQLWEGGPYWAECNVGATKPEEYGYYFWWGDTVGYTYDGSKWVAVDGSSTNFIFENWDNENLLIATMWKDASTLKSEGWIDESGNLASAHDAETVHLGAPWRMPTSEEIRALVDNCTTTWTTRNGVYGWLVTGKGAYASKSIFLPAAGYGYDSTFLYNAGSSGNYWSSVPNSDSSGLAWSLYFDSCYFSRNDDYHRIFGQSVRPLRGFAK